MIKAEKKVEHMKSNSEFGCFQEQTDSLTMLQNILFLIVILHT